MTYSIKVEADAILMVLSGSVDLSNTPTLKEEFEQLMSSDVNWVYLNAGEVDYIDSSGVATLLFIKKVCTRFHAELSIASISSQAARVIQLANLSSVLGIQQRQIVENTSNELKFSTDDALNIFNK